jgi:geranylgeranyl pyrophosphate synthase
LRYRERLKRGVGDVYRRARVSTQRLRRRATADAFYGQVESTTGWRDADARTRSQPGKLLRPALLLAACELAAAHAEQIDGANDAVTRASLPRSRRVVHNFSLIHDDIEDGEEARHHRATLWKVWGEAHAINTGRWRSPWRVLETAALIELGVCSRSSSS